MMLNLYIKDSGSAFIVGEANTGTEYQFFMLGIHLSKTQKVWSQKKNPCGFTSLLYGFLSSIN